VKGIHPQAPDVKMTTCRILQGISLRITNSQASAWIKQRVTYSCKPASTQETKETKEACCLEYDLVPGAKTQRTPNNLQNHNNNERFLRVEKPLTRPEENNGTHLSSDKQGF